MQPRRRATMIERLSPRNALRLCEGRDWPHMDEAEALTDTQLEVAWHRHKGAILDWWLHTYPGTRPWAWWQYEAQEPRKMVASGPTRHKGLKDVLRGRRLSYGLPADTQGIADYDLVCSLMESFFERQCMYLDRLGILTQAEADSGADFYVQVQLMHARSKDGGDCPSVSIEDIEAFCALQV